MSWSTLKALYESRREELDQLDVFRRLYLETLFEINGNLDTLALQSRAQTEILDKIQRQTEIFFASLNTMVATIKPEVEKAVNAPKNARTAKKA